MPATVFRLDACDRTTSSLADLMPADAGGRSARSDLIPTPGGEGYVYSYDRTLSELYLVEA